MGAGWGAAIGGIVPAILDMIGDRSNLTDAEKADNQERVAEKFAKNQIRWKVADARYAGLHPLAALGMSTSSGPIISYGPRNNTFARIGQNLGRAAEALLSKEDRAYNEEMRKLNLERERAELEGIKIRNRNNANNSTPITVDQSGLVSPGQGDATTNPNVNFVKPKIKIQEKPGFEAGVAPFEGFKRDKDGYMWPVLTQDMTEMLEDNLPFKARYYSVELKRWLKGFLNPRWRSPKTGSINENIQSFMLSNKPPKKYLRPNEYYEYSRKMGMWRVKRLQRGSKFHKIRR
jgi:hypothetical protein